MDIYNKLEELVSHLDGEFTTFYVVNEFSRLYPKDYAILVEKYGEGEAGSGKCYSLRNYIGLALLRLFKKSKSPISFLYFIDASVETNWGNPIIAYWKKK